MSRLRTLGPYSSAALMVAALVSPVGLAIASPLHSTTSAGGVPKVRAMPEKVHPKDDDLPDPWLQAASPLAHRGLPPSSAELVRYERARAERLKRRQDTCQALGFRAETSGVGSNKRENFGWCGLVQTRPSVLPLPVVMPL